MIKAQASVEYLLVIAGTLAILIPFGLVFITQSRDSKIQANQQQIAYIGNDIITQAEYLYNTGGFSKRTLEHQLPSNVVNVTVIPQTRELTFYSEGSTGRQATVFYSKVPINGRFPSVENFGNIVLINKESYVLICTTTTC